MHDLASFKKELELRGASGLALDIDETLSESDPFWWNMMYKAFPVSGLTLEQLRQKYESISDVPAWQTDAANTFFAGTLISNELVEDIPLLHKSNEVVSRLDAIVPIYAYITARPELVRPATERWLKRHKFPEAELILRPNNLEFQKKDLWKAEVLNHLYPHIVGIVDDNPKLIATLAETHYPGKFFLYGRQWRKIEADKYPFELIISPTWDHVLDHFMAKT